MMCSWDYSYKTREGEWRTGRIDAPKREAVFAQLKSQGIRPIRVALAPGALNRLKSIGKRGWTIVVLALLCLVLGVLFLRSAESNNAASAEPSANAPAPLPRQRIPDLPPDYLLRVQQVFPTASERFLAQFAEPGLYYTLVPDESVSLADFDAALKHPIELAPDDPPWLATLKRIVIGMKHDAELLRSQGRPTRDIELWLRERQKMESTYRNQIITGPGDEKTKSSRLRSMGL